MNKIKVIDLLNMISKGEEVPKKIKIDNRFCYEYDKDIDYKSKDGTYLFDNYMQINKEDMNKEVEILEEEKKIPEKLKSLNNVGNSKDLCEFKDKQQLNNHLLKDKLNEVIHYLQYLKSKGE